ncbi:MAG: response regulator transcription factor [Bacillaceae bacterium]|nr:response regulator transcription factor [Bacillaceae bacterium]
MNERIVVISDDITTINSIKNFLRPINYLICIMKNPESAIEHINFQETKLVIIDLDSMGYRSFDFCREFRLVEERWTPIIIVSEKDEEFDQVLSFELGADDFIKKPLREKQFQARIKSIVRRHSLCCTESAVKQIQNQHTNEEIVICKESFTVHVHNQNVDLTKREYELLLYLCENKGTAISRESLLAIINEMDVTVDPRIVDVVVSKLREKIEPCRNKPKYIKTVRNVGYMMSETGIMVY